MIQLRRSLSTKGELIQEELSRFQALGSTRILISSLFFILLNELYCLCAFWVYVELNVCVVLKSNLSILGCSPTRVCVCVCVCVCVLLLSKRVCVFYTGG